MAKRFQLKGSIWFRILFIVLWIIIFCGFVLVLNVGNVMSIILNNYYPERTIYNDDLGSEQAILKDFSINQNGEIISETTDPWIYVPYETNNLSYVTIIDINVENAGKENELVYLYYVDSYKYESFTLRVGMNRIFLENIKEPTVGLRLDLTAVLGQNLHINSIVLNNNQYLTERLCQKLKNCLIFLICIEIVLGLYCVDIFPQKISNLSERKKRIYIIISILAMLFMICCGIWSLAFLSMIIALILRYSKRNDSDCLLWLFGLGLGTVFAYKMPAENIWILLTLEDKILFLYLFILIWICYCRKWDLCLGIVFYIGMHAYIQHALNEYSILYLGRHFLFTASTVVNIFLLIGVMLFFQYLLGRHLGNFSFSAILAIYFIANCIKIKYQNSLFCKADLYLLKEIIGIAGQFISLRYIALCAMCIFVIGILCIVYRKKIRRYLKPNLNSNVILVAAAVGIFCWSIIGNCYSKVGINVDQIYLNSQERINALGYGVYTLLEFSGMQKSAEPEGYGEGITDFVNKSKDTSTETVLKPTVILILAESLFEAESVPDISFNKEITGNLASYKVANIISPSYGGRTAVAEFEALTGLTNLYIAGDVVPYVSYLNKAGNNTGSLAREFHNNGYSTYAVHANKASYYSRDKVYENMGFDTFISREKMNLSENDYLKDGYIKDSVLVDQIINILDNEDKPTFIFGVSLEGHSPYIAKYDSIDINATSAKYDETILEELSSYGQTVYNFDEQMGRLIDYVEEKDQPTLIYIFGDHIPPININELDGCLDDVWQKYRTVLYAYSNYCDVTISDECISLNQVAPEILKKSGIKHRAYFDYIYNLRDVYPVIHKEIELELTNEDLRMYSEIQWDLLFGERYLLQ